MGTERTRDAIVEVLRESVWMSDGWHFTKHRNHPPYDSACGICRGDVHAIADRLASEIERIGTEPPQIVQDMAKLLECIGTYARSLPLDTLQHPDRLALEDWIGEARRLAAEFADLRSQIEHVNG